MTSKIYLFTYGTLKRGSEPNKVYLSNAKFIGSGTTEGKYKMCHVGYPMIFIDEEGYPVKGELYEINTEDIYTIDRYEGYPHLYSRKMETIHVNNKEYKAWIYYNKDDLRRACEGFIQPNMKGVLEW